MSRFQPLWIAIVLASILAFSSGELVAQEKQEAKDEWVQPTLPERFSTWAVVMGTHASGLNTRLQIKIDRWSTPEEREQLLAKIVELSDSKNRRVMADKQAEALRKQKECGFIRATGAAAARRGSTSERLRYAWQWREEGTGKRRLVLALDRPIDFLELVRGGRTLDYGITIVVLDLDENNEGSGLLSLGTMVTFDKDTERLTLENYSSEPVRLMNVKKTS
jgi:hypothetical protein